jgi:hypothetical protein
MLADFNFLGQKSGHDIYGLKIENHEANGEIVECLICRKSLSASRFAPHLERCMGLGGRTAGGNSNANFSRSAVKLQRQVRSSNFSNQTAHSMAFLNPNQKHSPNEEDEINNLPTMSDNAHLSKQSNLLKPIMNSNVFNNTINNSSYNNSNSSAMFDLEFIESNGSLPPPKKKSKKASKKGTGESIDDGQNPASSKMAFLDTINNSTANGAVSLISADFGQAEGAFDDLLLMD